MIYCHRKTAPHTGKIPVGWWNSWAEKNTSLENGGMTGGTN